MVKDKNFVINLNKPQGITSQDAVTKVKRILSVKKAGHAGTLDPIATGILLICVNEATKIARFLTETDKEYIAGMKLGEKTDTLDSEGKVLRKAENIAIDIIRVNKALKKFKGTVQQIPPMYSAIKFSGQPLYKLARKGIEVERKPKEINIYELDVLSFNPPFLDIRVACSKGTYIRSLCADIGEELGVGAHTISIERTKVGNFSIQDAVTFEELYDNGKGIYSMDAALKHLSEVTLGYSDFRKALDGISIRTDAAVKLPLDSYIKLKNPEGILFAIGRLAGTSLIKVERVLNVLSERVLANP